MSPLHVVTCIGNPVRWKSRIDLYKAFEAHMLESGAKLTTVECAYGERDFEIPTNERVNHVKVRASGRNMSWNKESLLNIGISRIPEAKYIATIDADVRFRNRNWVDETLHALQHFHVVQPWTSCYDLGPNDEHLAAHKSFAALVQQGKPVVQGPNAKPGGYEFGHPGYAWAWTRDALEWAGGLIEAAALGAADHHMAMALINKVDHSIHSGLSDAYKEACHLWQDRIFRHVQGRIGALAGTIEHGWHGNKTKRAYVSRWDILIKHGFDPMRDLKRNTFGVLELSGSKPLLSRDIHSYFASRDEDATTLG
jgi:hypothetical protein